jgi:hypothetical protein
MARTPRTLALTIVVAALAIAQPRWTAAQGTGPAFDCSRATGTYEGQNLSFRNKGNEATVIWLGETLKCQAR